MEFLDIAKKRQSCRHYNENKEVEKEKILSVLQAARLAPSACNSQPYHISVCTGDLAKEVAKATTGMGLNKFAKEAPVLLVISEKPYNKSAALGAKVKGNDYRSIDIGIMVAYLTSQATSLGLETCILGWLDDEKIRKLCGIDETIRLVITLGYAHNDEVLRNKKRKTMEEMVTFK